MGISKANRRKNNSLNRKNIKVFFILSLIMFTMLSLSYASVPLYDIFCRLTGFGGTPKIVDSYKDKKLVKNDLINIRFDTNVSPKLNWKFYSEIKLKKINIGEETKINYIAENLSNQALVGTSVFNVSPAKAGQYFMKIECFCFNEQKLDPGESISMPVVFYIDPEIKSDLNTLEINEITLSYTFMPFITQNTEENT